MPKSEKAKKYDPLTDCGCNCKKCYCSEVACYVHPHCFGERCNLDALFDSLVLARHEELTNLESFMQFISNQIVGFHYNKNEKTLKDAKKKTISHLIASFGKWVPRSSVE